MPTADNGDASQVEASRHPGDAAASADAQCGGPSSVPQRAAATAGGAREVVVPNYIDLVQAQRSRVVHFPGLLLESDLGEVKAYHGLALGSGDPMETNPQNRQHHRKRCTFLHGATAPDGGLVARAPRVLAKLLRAAVRAKELGEWGDSAAASGDIGGPDGAGVGPLAGIDFRRLNIRVVELWEYDVGGGLVDDLHYDAGSIVTVVCLVSDRSDFTGGTFRTLEASGEHLEHHLDRGDALVLLSHKYHNITPVLSGRRCTLVMELWQGGLEGWCR